ncbi:MAG TPA: pilus assembly protein [Rhodospirillaceae bacterium]|nr:pilus assembly protein [Rhodospirillaceae bacterium]
MGRFVRRWWKGEDAATAVEFALVAFPFFYLLVGIIELSIMFAAMSTLDAATNDAARLIRTGQVQQTNGDPRQMFEDVLCGKVKGFIPCNAIQYEVITMDGFSDFASYPASFDEDGNLQSAGFDPGSVDDVVLIRAAYRYPLLTPLLGAAFADSPHNSKLMITTVVLETEPYDVRQVVDEL